MQGQLERFQGVFHLQVNAFIYLDSTITDDRTQSEILIRVAEAKQAFLKMKNTYLEPLLLYSCGT